MCLIFRQDKDIYQHEAQPLLRGTKFILRGNVLYTPEIPISVKEDNPYPWIPDYDEPQLEKIK